MTSLSMEEDLKNSLNFNASFQVTSFANNQKFRINFLCQQWQGGRKKNLTLGYWCLQGRGCCSAQHEARKAEFSQSWFYWYPLSGPQELPIESVSCTSPSLLRASQSVSFTKNQDLDPTATDSSEGKAYLHIQKWGMLSLLGIKQDFKSFWWPPPHCVSKANTSVKRQGGDESYVSWGHIQSLALFMPSPPISVTLSPAQKRVRRRSLSEP